MAEMVERLAGQIVDFFEIMSDRTDERREDPEWQPYVEIARTRYDELKGKKGFTAANNISMREAVAKMIDAALSDRG